MRQTQNEIAGLQETSIQDYIDLLRRRKVIFVQTLVVVLAVGVMVTLMTKPIFHSQTRILVEGKALALAQYNTSDPLGNLFLPDVGHDIQTQVEVLQSEKVLTEAYRAAAVPGDGARVFVKEAGATDVIDVDVESNNKVFAEHLAKSLPETFFGYLTGNRKSELSNALIFAQTHLADEKEKLRKAEFALQAFKENQNVANVDAERGQQITNASSTTQEVQKGEVDIASERAKLQALRASYSAEPEYLESPTQTSNSLVGQIDERIALLKTERAGLEIKFKPESAEMRRIDAQIQDLERHLSETPATVTTTTRTVNPQRAIYLEKIAESQSALAALEAGRQRAAGNASKELTGLKRFGGLERQQTALQREVAQTQSVVAQLSNSVLDLSLRDKANHAPGRVIAGPTAPIQVAPKPVQNMLYAGAVGIVLGICFSLLQEFLDDRIHTSDEARRMLDVPVLGYVPLVDREEQRLLCRARGVGPLLESYRVMRSNVQFATVDTPASSILVTSSVPGEGKSTTAANLAVAMALDGKSVIIVDADLRLPTLHEKLQLAASPGLTNVMVGNTPLDEALQQTKIPGLRLLSAGPLPPNPAELLHSQTMQQLHLALKERADIVIFDSPPCLATADAQVLSAEVDGVIYVMQFGAARKSGVRHAGDLLHQAQARVLGVIFNKMTASDQRDNYYYSAYGYYKSGYGQTNLAVSRVAEFEALLKRNGHDASEGLAAVATLEREPVRPGEEELRDAN